MREDMGLYRGKQKDNGEWFHGNLLKLNKRAFIVPQNTWFKHGELMAIIEVIPETVGQYTGLTDKNGKKIFEGDILRPFDNEIVVVSWIDHYSTLGLIVYLTNTLIKRGKEITKTYKGMALLWDYDLDKSEIIGNIHDNPELLPNTANC